MSSNESAVSIRPSVLRTPPCKVCAPRVPGKLWGLATTSGAGAIHDCVRVVCTRDGMVAMSGRATSKVVSWHLSRDAAARARSEYRKKTNGARAFILHVDPMGV